MKKQFLAGASHAERSGASLLEQFIIVGAGSGVREGDEDAEPEVLYRYPPDSELTDPS